ncbi:hypothetical protein Hanom_Chr14g01336611 [Helianthus anomalus]
MVVVLREYRGGLRLQVFERVAIGCEEGGRAGGWAAAVDWGVGVWWYSAAVGQVVVGWFFVCGYKCKCIVKWWWASVEVVVV